MKFFKANWLILIAIILVLIFVGTCNMHRILPKREVKIETVVLYDTLWLKSDTTFLNKYLPGIIKTIPGPTISLPHLDSVSRLQYAELVNLYLKEVEKNTRSNIYKDSFKIYDKNTKKNIATFHLTDTVSENKIQNRHPSYTIDSLPMITKTITNTVTEPAVKKNQIYLGTEVGGHKDRILNSVELGAMFKNKKDRIYKIGYQWTNSSPAQYKAGVYFKL